jgi:hypothetical protein
MKKFVWIFSLFWAVSCLTITGAQVIQPFIIKTLSIDPNTTQDQTGSIYNQGARAAGEQLAGYDKAVFIDANDRLEHLSLLYWLYPVQLIRSTYGADLRAAIQKPEQDAIIFVGHRDIYEQALATKNPAFTASVIKTIGDDVFAIIKRS